MGEPITIQAFGDSLTQGYGLSKQNGLVPQLDRWLAENGQEVELINGGVSGDTTAGGLRRIDWSLTPEVDAVIVALGGNDLLRGTPLNTVSANLDKILDRVAARGLPTLLVGYRATANFGPEYKGAFDEMYPTLAARHDVVFHPYIFEGMARAVEAGKATRAEVFQGDGIHPNARGVAWNVQAMGPAVVELIEKVRAR